MSRVTIPRTIEEASTKLADLDGLITGTEWQRAAIVWAFTIEDQAGGRARNAMKNTRIPNAVDGAQLTPSAFARLGIYGFRQPRNVSAYREAWRLAMKHGAPNVAPGDRVELPTIKWPGIRPEEQETSKRIKEAQTKAEKNPAAFAEGLKPAAAAAIVGAVVERHPAAMGHVVKEHPEAVAEAIVKAPERKQSTLLQEVKQRRAGVDTSKRARKEREAARDQLLEPVNDAIADLHVRMIAEHLREAAEWLRQARVQNAFTPELWSEIRDAYEDVTLAMHEAEFVLDERSKS